MPPTTTASTSPCRSPRPSTGDERCVIRVELSTDHRPDPFDDDDPRPTSVRRPRSRPLERRAPRNGRPVSRPRSSPRTSCGGPTRRSREVELFASIAVLVNESRDALSALGARPGAARHCDFAVSHVLVPDADGAFVTADIWDADPGARVPRPRHGATVDEALRPAARCPARSRRRTSRSGCPTSRPPPTTRATASSRAVVVGVPRRHRRRGPPSSSSSTRPRPRRRAAAARAPIDRRPARPRVRVGGARGAPAADRRRLEELLAQQHRGTPTRSSARTASPTTRARPTSPISATRPTPPCTACAPSPSARTRRPTRGPPSTASSTPSAPPPSPTEEPRRILGERTAVALDDVLVDPGSSGRTPRARAVVAHAERLGPDFVRRCRRRSSSRRARSSSTTPWRTPAPTGWRSASTRRRHAR